MSEPVDREAAFQAFLQRVWVNDVRPMLNDHRAQQRASTARTVGMGGAAAGMAVDKLLGLKGKPFTRALTVFGASMGAILPDALDWNWVRRAAGQGEREALQQQTALRAGEIDLTEALRLMGFSQVPSAELLREAWREAANRWHPDKAPDVADKPEYQLRFIALQHAYERIRAAIGA